jgi:hypothetical protein
LDKESLIELIRDGSRILTYGFIENQARSKSDANLLGNHQKKSTIKKEERQ